MGIVGGSEMRHQSCTLRTLTFLYTRTVRVKSCDCLNSETEALSPSHSVRGVIFLDIRERDVRKAH